jgi:hypothetical protein
METAKKVTPQTTSVQRLLIIEWLKKPVNFAVITGRGGAFRNGQKVKFKKKDAYQSLSQFITEKSNISWDHSMAKNRYEGIIDKFKKAKLVYK